MLAPDLPVEVVMSLKPQLAATCSGASGAVTIISEMRNCRIRLHGGIVATREFGANPGKIGFRISG